jgi:acyl-CoA synthetase (NDP forming)
LLLESAGELVDTAVCLLSTATSHPVSAAGSQRPSGTVSRRGAESFRVAFVGDSGGQGALAADAFAVRGFEVPELSARTTAEVAAVLPPGAGCRNPVDLAGSGEADLGSYARVARALLVGGDADAIVLTGYFGDYASANPVQSARECEVADELADAAGESGRALVVHTMARDTPALAVLRRRGIPVYERIEQAATALSGIARLTRPSMDPAPTRRASSPVPDGSYEAVRDLLSTYGLTFPAARFVTTADEAVDAAHLVGYPLVLKAMGLAHKTEAGGVALGLADADALRAAFRRMRAATGAERFAVEAMATPPYAHELIVGVRRGPAFGPVAMVGLGAWVTGGLLRRYGDVRTGHTSGVRTRRTRAYGRGGHRLNSRLRTERAVSSGRTLVSAARQCQGVVSACRARVGAAV